MVLYNKECISKMNELIEDGVKVDLVLTDPPYGTTANKWDKILSFDKVWECIDGLSTNVTTSLLFGSEPFSTHLRMSNIKDYRYDLYWIKNKTTGFQHAKNKPLKNLELISVFSKGKTGHKGRCKNRMTYNPQGLIPSNKRIKGAKKKFGNLVGARKSHVDEYVQEYTNYPKMVMNFKSSDYKYHPNQKPVELLEYLIKTYSNEGDTVLDFTMGSGSTGVACKKTGRKFIGIELDKDYYDICCDRINKQERFEY